MTVPVLAVATVAVTVYGVFCTTGRSTTRTAPEDHPAG